ncbi:hypothetical protein BH10PSE1_BH10PSE1_30370 [soil metagenome]
MRHHLFLLAIAALAVAGCKPTPVEKAHVAAPALASAPTPTPTPVVAVACAKDEKPFYICDFGAKRVAVCSKGATFIYRYGPSAKAELVLTRTAGQPGLLRDGIYGGGGGSQTSLTFVEGDYDYTVYSAVYGELTDIAGQTSSGLAVQKGHDEPVVRQCPLKTDAQSIGMVSIPEDVAVQTDESKSMWY